MKTCILFFVVLFMNTKIYKHAECSSAHTFYKKKSSSGNSSAGKLLNYKSHDNYFRTGSAKTWSGNDESITNSVRLRELLRHPEIFKNYNPAGSLKYGSLKPSFKNLDRFKTITNLYQTNPPRIYLVRNEGQIKSSNNSVFSEQKSGIFGCIPRNLINFGQFTTTTDLSTSLRPWQVSCCPQSLNRDYSKRPSSGRPWDCEISQTCLTTESSANTTRTNQTELITAQSQNINQTINSVSSAGQLETQATTPGPATGTVQVTQKTSRPPIYYKHHKHSTSAPGSVTVPYGQSALNSTHSSTSSATHTPDAFSKVANNTASQGLLQNSVRVNLLSRNVYPTPLEQINSEKKAQTTEKVYSRSLAIMKQYNQLPAIHHIHCNADGMQAQQNVIVSSAAHSNEIDNGNKLYPGAVQMENNNHLPNDNVLKRSVHIDFFPLGRNKYLSKTTKPCKIKFQSAPFYNLTALLGPVNNQKSSRRKLILNCTEELSTKLPNATSSLLVAVSAGPGPSVAIVAENVTSSANPSNNATKSTVSPVFKLKIGVGDSNARGRSHEPTLKVSDEDLNPADTASPTTCASGDATECTVQVTAQESEDAALTETETCTTSTSINNVTETIQSINTSTVAYSAIHRANILKSFKGKRNSNLNLNSNSINRKVKYIDNRNGRINKFSKVSKINPRNSKLIQEPKLNQDFNWERHKTITMNPYHKSRKKRTSNFLYNLVNFKNENGVVYAILPSNLTKRSSNFSNSLGNDGLIKPRSIFGQLLPCCIGKTIKPKDPDKKPWELPWTPRLDRFQLYTEDITQQPDIQKPDVNLLPPLQTDDQTTSDNSFNIALYGNTDICPTCGYKNQVPILNAQKQRHMQYEILGEQQEVNPARQYDKQGHIHYETENHHHTIEQTGNRYEVPKEVKYPDSKQEEECSCSLTYTLNYPKHDVYSLNKRATTIKCLKLIEKLNEIPKYYLEIPEALGDLIKKAASSNSSLESRNTLRPAEAVVKRKGKFISKNTTHSGSRETEKNINNVNSEPIFIVFQPNEAMESSVSIAASELHKLLETKIQSTTASTSQSVATETEVVGEFPACFRQDKILTAPRNKNLSPLKEMPVVLIPAYLPLSNEGLVNPTMDFEGNTNSKFNRPSLILNPTDIILKFGSSNKLSGVKHTESRLYPRYENTLNNAINKIKTPISLKKQNIKPDSLKTYSKQFNSAHSSKQSNSVDF